MKSSSKSAGPLMEKIEAKIAESVGTRFAVICSSARTAIRYSLLALNIGCGSEVVIPDFACQILPITVFCVGATPLFCDVDKKTLVLSSDSLEEVLGPKTKAVIFIHLFGIPVDPSPILEITQKKGILFIDDAAQALGASINGKSPGAFGDVGILSFNKFLNVDLGGAVTTNDQELAGKIKVMREKYESSSLLLSLGYRLVHILGLNSRKITKMVFWGNNYLYKLSHITLAKKHFREIGGWVKPDQNVLKLWASNALTPKISDQLMTYAGRYWHSRKMDRDEILRLGHEFEELEGYLQNRRKIARMYEEYLEEGNFKKIDPPQNSISSYMRYPILLNDDRKLLLCVKELGRAGFIVDYRYKPLHMSPFFGWTSQDFNFSRSTYVSNHILPLPVQPSMSSDNVKKIASIVNSHSSY